MTQQESQQALEGFSLRYRFTDPNYAVLPKEVLERIFPMPKHEADKLNEENLTFFSAPFELDPMKFISIDSISTDGAHASIREWLEEQLPELNSQLKVSWDKDTAATVSAKDFCTYWDDFCYPSSDDVIITPVKGNFVLYHFHEDVFFFGRRNRS